MKTILYSVSTGYFARNLLRTGVIEKLLESSDNRIIIVSVDYIDGNNFAEEFSYSDRIFLEKMCEVKRNHDVIDKLIWKTWLLGQKYKVFQNIYKFLLNFQLKKRYYNEFHSIYGKMFDKYKPDLVVGASPGINSKRDIPIFTEARERGIKTLALIHSWDNLAKRKGPLWVRPDILGVWNEVQKQEAINNHFYKDADVVPLGPPHFDIYWRNETFLTREAFFEKMGLDLHKKLITMIATVPGLARNSYIMDILLDAAENNKFIFPVQFICRPTPSIYPKINEREFGRFHNNPKVIMDNQIQYSSMLGWNPSKEQLYHFANLVKHTDVQVTIASTATIEAAIIDRPVVNVGFSTIEPERFKKLVIDSVYTNHFKVVFDCGATYVACNPEDLITGINKYLLNPDLHKAERENLKKTLVYRADGKAVERISQLIVKLLGQGN